MAERRTQEIVSGGTTALGAWIRSNRMEQRLSQRELASRSGLSRSYVCDIERGRGVHPSVETLDKLAAALGMARLDLLKAAGLVEPVANDRESSEERRILSVFRDLTDAGQQSVMQFARFVHAEEHQWVQANMLEGMAEPNGSEVAAIRRSGMVSLFELDDERGQ